MLPHRLIFSRFEFVYKNEQIQKTRTERGAMMNNLDLIYKKIGYTFKNPELLKRALTHSSYANEKGCRDNERLEFLGDSVLGIIISENIFRQHENTDEGGLSKMRASIVCEQTLEIVARKIELGDLILLGKGEERTGGRHRASVIADAFEALIAAIYLDSDLETARQWVLGMMKDQISNIHKDKYFGDFKTRLQEMVQGSGSSKITYSVLGETGLDHMKEFTVAVYINGNKKGVGVGFSKKEAEQRAAESAVRELSNETL